MTVATSLHRSGSSWSVCVNTSELVCVGLCRVVLKLERVNFIFLFLSSDRVAVTRVFLN